MVYQSTVVSELAIREIAGYVLKKNKRSFYSYYTKKKKNALSTKTWVANLYTNGIHRIRNVQGPNLSKSRL